jgi:uncharacterized protein YaaQ
MSASPNESNHPGHAGDGSELVTIAEVESDVEATAIAAELAEAGFDARVVAGSSGGFLTEGSGVMVLVPADQVAEAKKLADEILEEAKNIDWDDIDVGEMED